MMRVSRRTRAGKGGRLNADMGGGLVEGWVHCTATNARYYKRHNKKESTLTSVSTRAARETEERYEDVEGRNPQMI